MTLLLFTLPLLYPDAAKVLSHERGGNLPTLPLSRRRGKCPDQQTIRAPMDGLPAGQGLLSQPVKQRKREAERGEREPERGGTTQRERERERRLMIEILRGNIYLKKLPPAALHECRLFRLLPKYGFQRLRLTSLCCLVARHNLPLARGSFRQSFPRSACALEAGSQQDGIVTRTGQFLAGDCTREFLRHSQPSISCVFCSGRTFRGGLRLVWGPWILPRHFRHVCTPKNVGSVPVPILVGSCRMGPCDPIQRRHVGAFWQIFSRTNLARGSPPG